MRIAPFLFVSSLLCCALSSTSAAQQIESHDPASTPPATNALLPTGEVLRRRLLSIHADPLGELSREEPLVRIQTTALLLPNPDAGLGKNKTRLADLKGIYDLAADLHLRFRQTARPIEIERGGLYFKQDLYSTTKGVILHSFAKDRIDVGLYKRRYQASSTDITGHMALPGVAEATNRSYVFSGGRQIFVGVRLKLDNIFK